MTELAAGRSDGTPRPDTIQALGIGVMQTITGVATSGTVWFVKTGADGIVADALTPVIALAPDTGHYLKVVPGVDKVAAYDGSAGGVTANAVGANTTVVWVYYDSTAGTVYVTEMT